MTTHDGEATVPRDPLALPRIVSLSTRVATYATPKIFFVGNERREVRRALEITVETATAIPQRALSPVLWLGDTQVSDFTTVGPRRYVFYAVEPAQLRDGARIAFGWPEAVPVRGGAAPPETRVATRYRLRLGQGLT